jgi:putative radical SAM enzyme (TIGR03279 family)
VNQPTEQLPLAAAGGVIEHVRPGSLADQAGIHAASRLIAVNGNPLLDVVDYQFEAAEDRIDLLIDQDGIQQHFLLEKHPDEDAGLEFEEATFDGTRICVNKCPFCFLKGLPKGLRRTMYVKDDDYRLSFLHGNFVTLTNLSESDWQRLEAQRLSPLNVSVHATEPGLRRRLLGNDDIPDILDQLRRLGSIGIRAQTQVVLCPGINDGEHLTRTIEDLAGLYPTVQAVSVVPVGASIQYAERMAAVGRDSLGACSPVYARRLIGDVRRLQRRFRANLDSTFCYLSDEFYLTAGAVLPAARNYDGFAQYENGVGMTRSLLDDWRRLKRNLRRYSEDFAGLRLTIACGTLIAPTMQRMAAEIEHELRLRITVVPVPNSFFGETIRVSGLLGAGDFIGALRQTSPADVIFLPRSALDYFGKHFLDDGTPSDVERVLGQPIAFATAWSEVIDQLREWRQEKIPFATGPGATSNGRFWALPERERSQPVTNT